MILTWQNYRFLYSRSPRKHTLSSSNGFLCEKVLLKKLDKTKCKVNAGGPIHITTTVGSDVLLFLEFINIIFIFLLYLHWIHYIVIHFLVIYFARYKECMICLISFNCNVTNHKCVLLKINKILSMFYSQNTSHLDLLL